MMEVEVGRVLYNDLAEYMERTFRQVAHDKGLNFDIQLGRDLPQGIFTDQRRLQQVLKYLLSNAF
jgi:signal transduction histidine kinase